MMHHFPVILAYHLNHKLLLSFILARRVIPFCSGLTWPRLVTQSHLDLLTFKILYNVHGVTKKFHLLSLKKCFLCFLILAETLFSDFFAAHSSIDWPRIAEPGDRVAVFLVPQGAT